MDGLLAAIEFGVYAAMVAVGAAFVWRQWQARRLARSAAAVQAPVLWDNRVESGSRSYAWFVETLYDVPGHGELLHRKGFEKEGPALLFARLHREGSVHWVVPNEIDTGQVFLREELDPRGDWLMPALMVLAMGLAAWAAYAVAVEYWEP